MAATGKVHSRRHHHITIKRSQSSHDARKINNALSTRTPHQPASKQTNIPPIKINVKREHTKTTEKLELSDV